MDLRSTLTNLATLGPLHEDNHDGLITYEHTAFHGLHVLHSYCKEETEQERSAFMVELHLNKVKQWVTVDEEDGSNIFLGSHENSLVCDCSLDLENLFSVNGCKTQLYDQFHKLLVLKNKVSQEFWDMFHENLSILTREIAVQAFEDKPTASKVTMIMEIEVLTTVDVPYEDQEEVMGRVHGPYVDSSPIVFPTDEQGRLVISCVDDDPERRFEKEKLKEADCLICDGELLITPTEDIMQMPCKDYCHRDCWLHLRKTVPICK